MSKEIIPPELPTQPIVRRLKERIFPGDATIQLLKRQVLVKILSELRASEPEVFEGGFERRRYGLELSGGNKRYFAELSLVEFETGAEGVGITVSEAVSTEAPEKSLRVQLSKAPWDSEWSEWEYLMKLSGEENYSAGTRSSREPRNFTRREMLSFLKGVLAADVVHKLDSPE